MLTAMRPRIELLWWQGCPSVERTLSDLRAALTDVGLDLGAPAGDVVGERLLEPLVHARVVVLGEGPLPLGGGERLGRRRGGRAGR